VVNRVTAVEPNVVTVFFAALVTALATGLGALPLIFVRSAGRVVLGVSNAIAAGVMLAASVSLCRQGVDRGLWRTTVGLALGICFVLATERHLEHDHRHTLGSLSGEDARRALLIVGVMTVHSAAEGIGVGAAFADGSTLGLLITIAIAVHNIPEGLAISLVLVPRGTSVSTAAGWSIFSSLPQPLLAVPAFLFVDRFKSILPIGLGFAAGAMVWMVLRELVPEALETASARIVVLAGGTAFALMLGFQLLLS
jgi:zinc transporter, ZIP family